MSAKLEAIAVDWLRDLFELPREFQGALVTGATMANLTALGHWGVPILDVGGELFWGQDRIADVEAELTRSRVPRR